MKLRTVVVFVARRQAVLVGLLIVLSFAVFALLYIAPGDPVQILLGPSGHSEAQVEALRQRHHLDEPFWSQYWIWLTHAAQLDFGTSIQTSLPVSSAIADRLPTSLLLGLYAYVLTLVLGLALGILAALKRRGRVDRAIVAGSLVGLSIPPFVSGIALLFLFTVVIRWFPSSPRSPGLPDQLWYMTLPAVVMAMAGTAYIVKHTRAALTRALDEDYVVFARARGLSYPRVLFKYGLRNAMIPVISIAAPLLAFMLTGVVLVEVVFSVPGIGQLLVQSALTKDLPMLQGVALVVAAIVLLANLAADLLYLAADPRVRIGGA